jgi:hypothetical protein
MGFFILYMSSQQAKNAKIRDETFNKYECLSTRVDLLQGIKDREEAAILVMLGTN